MDSLRIFIPYRLANGKCCKSRVVVAEGHQIERVSKHFQTRMQQSRAPFGLIVLDYEWTGNQWEYTEGVTQLAGNFEGMSETLVERFENFDATLPYYRRLDARGLPFPGDVPVMRTSYPKEPRSKRPHVTRGPKLSARGPRRPRRMPSSLSRFFSNRPTRAGWRTPRSDIRAPSPLFQRREMSFPPRGCHPFVVHRVATAAALKKLSEALRRRAFHNYELCDFGDVSRAQRSANFQALKRRRGNVVGIYHLGRHPFTIVTDVKTGIALLGLHEEYA